MPFSLRYRLGFDRKATGQLIRCFHRALKRHMTHRAKQALGLGSVTDAKIGGITFVQRTGSALRLNVHLHTLMLDGVFMDGQFHALQPSGQLCLFTSAETEPPKKIPSRTPWAKLLARILRSTQRPVPAAGLPHGLGSS